MSVYSCKWKCWIWLIRIHNIFFLSKWYLRIKYCIFEFLISNKCWLRNSNEKFQTIGMAYYVKRGWWRVTDQKKSQLNSGKCSPGNDASNGGSFQWDSITDFWIDLRFFRNAHSKYRSDIVEFECWWWMSRCDHT